MRLRSRLATITAAAGVAAAGCGARAADLFVLQRTGVGPGAAVRIVVSDAGRVRCNAGAGRALPAALLLGARALERAVARDAQARRAYPERPGAVLAYRLRSAAGTVRWADTSRPLPARYFRLAAFARRVSTDVCGLPR